MKTFTLLAGLVGAFAMASAASAATFDFSYIGQDGQTFAGSFSGTVNGSVVDVTSVNDVTFDGQAFAGPLYAMSYIQGPGGGCTVNCYAPSGAVVSLTNPLDDNFLFINGGNPASNYFYVIPWSNGAGNPTAVQGFFGGQPYDNYNGEFIPANFKVSEVSAAPEPSTWMLMIAGVAMIGCALRVGRKRGVGSLSIA